MSDDPTMVLGCRRKRKYGLLKYLLGAAVLFLSILFMTANEDKLSDHISSLFHRSWTQWKSSMSWADQPGMLMGDRTLCFADGIVYLESADGTVLSRIETEFIAPVLSIAEQYAAVYEPGGSDLLILGEETHCWIEVSTGILGAAVSPSGAAAVITAGSGYQNVILRYNDRGETVSKTGFLEKAAVMLSFLEETLVACLCSTDGTWCLNVGEEAVIPLDTEIVYDLRPCGGNIALWCGEGIYLYSPSGRLILAYPCEPSELVCWDTHRSIAAVIGNRLVLLGESGVTEIPLAYGAVRQVSVCGSTVCVLTAEQIYFYNEELTLLGKSSHGACAVSAEAIHGGAYLFGDGEKLCQMTS